MSIPHYRYLVVEDDVLVSALVASMLNKIHAAKVDIAENGEAALQYLAATPEKMPDIIISDLNMPLLDGVEFLRHLAGKEFTGGLILISGNEKRFIATVANLAKEYHLNLIGALSKPFTPFALQRLLASFNGTKKMHAPILPGWSVTPEALRAAIENNQLVPFFQPKVLVKTGMVIGVEALARWQHPEHGLIPPNLFIPVAEKHGLIDLLTKDILRKTLEQAALWHKNGLPFTFAVNFSARSLSDIELPDRLEADLRNHDIDPSYLTVEVTESYLLENITASLETLLRLRLKGIHLSIDDFGTGHSSMEELHRIPFSELKIDRLFVNGAAHNEEAHLFLQSAAVLAKHLNLSVVAEGVETQADWDVCARLGCDVIQGFLVARPMPADVFLDWCNTRKNSVEKTKPGRNLRPHNAS